MKIFRSMRLFLNTPHVIRLLLLSASLVAFYAIGWLWGLPSEFSPAVDSPVPLSPLAFVAEYGNPHIAEKYPAAHQLLLLLPYAALLLLFKLSGELRSLSSQWPYGFVDPAYAFSSLIVVSRMISTVMAIGILLTLRTITLNGRSEGDRLSALLILAGSGAFTYYARVGNFDVPYLFWWSLSFALLWKYLHTGIFARRYLIWCAMCSALAIATKDQAGGLVVGSALVIAFVRGDHDRSLNHRLNEAAIFTAATLGVYFMVGVLPQPIRWLEHIKVWLPGSPSITNYRMYDQSLMGQLQLASQTLILISRVLSPAGLLFAALGIVRLLSAGRGRDIIALTLPVLVYYLVIILPIGFVYERFVLPITYALAIFAGVGLMTVWQAGRARAVFVKALSTVAVGFTIGLQWTSGYLPVTYVQLFDAKRTLARELPADVSKNAPVLWLGNTVGLPNAAIYENYKLILPQGRSLEARSLAHVLHPYDDTWTYALSNSPAEHESFGTRIRSWKYPEWIKLFVHTFGVGNTEYYLYTRDTGHVKGITQVNQMVSD